MDHALVLDEKDTSPEMRWYLKGLADVATKALKRNNFEVEFAADRREALAKVLALIPDGATIGGADSVTLHQIGFFDWLSEQKDHEVLNPFAAHKWDDKWKAREIHIARYRLMQRALTADVFVTGLNAVTRDGKLVSIDAKGNRVAAMCFGPGKVIYVVSANKIVKDVEEAIRRIHDYAAPINTRRHIEKHHLPVDKLHCAITATCSDCRSDTKGCRITTIVDGWAPWVHTSVEHPPTVILVGEPLGY